MLKPEAVMVGALIVLMACPVLIAQDEAKPVILVYHGPKVGDQDLRLYGEAIADVINSDPRLKDKADIVLVGDQDLMNTLLYFPQVKCVVMALTTWELTADRIVPSTLWYFNQGGGIVGLGNAGNGAVTKELNATVFPIFGNQYYMVKPTFRKDPVTGRRIIERKTTYIKAATNDITEGVADQFTLSDKRFVVHMNTTVSPPKFVPMQPKKGTYTVLYKDKDLGAPLVVLYEENGTSVTFAGTDQISVHETDETYFGNLLNDENFRKLLQNSVYYVWSHETKYEEAMAKAKQEFQKMKEEQDQLMKKVEESQKKRKAARLTRAVLLIVVGIVLIGVISYYCFVIPARQRRMAEETPEEPGEAAQSEVSESQQSEESEEGGEAS